MGSDILEKEPKHLDLISRIFYNRESEKWGKYRVTEFIEFRGKTEVEYYKCKFKDTGNIIEAPIKTILENKVIDIDKQKNNTIKHNRNLKKEILNKKREYKKCVKISGKIKLLSLDVSSHSTGYSIFGEKKLVKYGYLYEPKKKYVTDRLNSMKHKIINVINENDINVVCIEDIIYKTKISLAVLSKAQGIILDWLYENDIDVGVVSVMEWKSAYDINRNSKYKGKNSRIVSKKKTLDCVNRDFNLKLEDEFSDYPRDLREPPAFDVADSIALGKIFLEKYIIRVDKN